MRWFLALLAVGLSAGGCGSSAKSNSAGPERESRVVLRADCGTPQPRPSEIVLTCADHGVYLAGLRWSRWGTRVASASGVINVHGCDPDCADDNRTYTYTVNVTAHQPVSCNDGSRQYAFIRIRVTDGRMDENRPQDEDVGYDCPS